MSEKATALKERIPFFPWGGVTGAQNKRWQIEATLAVFLWLHPLNHQAWPDSSHRFKHMYCLLIKELYLDISVSCVSCNQTNDPGTPSSPRRWELGLERCDHNGVVLQLD